jgi:hypothetical protein
VMSYRTVVSKIRVAGTEGLFQLTAPIGRPNPTTWASNADGYVRAETPRNDSWINLWKSVSWIGSLLLRRMTSTWSFLHPGRQACSTRSSMDLDLKARINYEARRMAIDTYCSRTPPAPYSGTWVLDPSKFRISKLPNNQRVGAESQNCPLTM